MKNNVCAWTSSLEEIRAGWVGASAHRRWAQATEVGCLPKEPLSLRDTAFQQGQRGPGGCHDEEMLKAAQPPKRKSVAELRCR